ncbi:MAG: hypothetical protein QGH73_17475 [Rhodospirillales bacterium]|nr:hypothetical protein [Rhodospirillales bacterium]
MFKFISKAMLSVVMDKNAREKLDKSKGPARKASAKKKKGKPAREPEADAPVLAKRPDAERAVKKILAGSKAEKTEAFQKLLSEKLAKAKPGSKKAPPGSGGKGEMDREKLITAALAVQKSQAHLLDGVDEKVKEKMRRLAAERLMGDGRTKH